MLKRLARWLWGTPGSDGSRPDDSPDRACSLGLDRADGGIPTGCGDATTPPADAELASAARAMSGLDEWCRRPEVCEIGGLCGGIVVAQYLQTIARIMSRTLGNFVAECGREVDKDDPDTGDTFVSLAWRTRQDLYQVVGFAEPLGSLRNCLGGLRSFSKRYRDIRDGFDRLVFYTLREQRAAGPVDLSAASGAARALAEGAATLAADVHNWSRASLEGIRQRREGLETL